MRPPLPPYCGRGQTIGPPDYIGLGAQKAGTTWWHELVQSHPEVFRPRGLPKEVHFFDSCPPLRTNLPGLARAYYEFFPRPGGCIVGEWTPRYIYDFWVPPLLSKVAGDARLLVLVRDPVERFRSGLTLNVRLNGSMSKAAVDEAFQRGFYWAQLKRLMRWIDRDNILLLQFEQCVREPSRQLAATYAFLGIDPAFRPKNIGRRVNGTRGRKLPLSGEQSEWLRDAFADDSAALANSFPGIDLSLWGDKA